MTPKHTRVTVSGHERKQSSRAGPLLSSDICLTLQRTGEWVRKTKYHPDAMSHTQVAMKAGQTTHKDHESCNSDKTRHSETPINIFFKHLTSLRPSAVYNPQQRTYKVILIIIFGYRESAKTQALSQIPSCSRFCFAFSLVLSVQNLPSPSLSSSSCFGQLKCARHTPTSNLAN